MILDTLRTLPDALVAQVDPARVKARLHDAGWIIEPRLGRGLATVYQRPESPLHQVAVPDSRDVADFTLAMGVATCQLAEWEKRPALEVLHELLLPPVEGSRSAEAVVNGEQRRTFVGFVEVLYGQPGDGGWREGAVLLRLLDNGVQPIWARAQLGRADYELACRAHNPAQLVRLQALLRRAGSQCHLDDVRDFQMLGAEQFQEAGS